MLKYCSGAGCTPALTVFALTDDIHTVVMGMIDEGCNIVNLGKICIVCISPAAQDLKVEVVQLAVKDLIANAAVINVGVVLVDTLYFGVVKADNGGVIG